MAGKEEKNTPVAADTINEQVAQALALIAQSLAAQQQNGSALTVDAIAKVATDAYKAGNPQRGNDPALHEAKSAFNPKGEREHPRPALLGEVLWNGYPLRRDDLLEEEINLLNQLRPGTFRNGTWKVIDLEPGNNSIEHRRYIVTFPCKELEQRMTLPSMRDMLREMVGANAPVPVGA